MSIFKNKHMLVATLMAPILGLVAYFGIGALLGEKPHVAESGQSYLLMEKPNCRYASGVCGLKNVDFELTLTYEWLENGDLSLMLKSENPLDGVLLALVENEADENQPVNMQPAGSDGMNWSLTLDHPDPERHRLALVASNNQTLYYGDVALTFTLKEIEYGNQ
jgi:hypothetical protein